MISRASPPTDTSRSPHMSSSSRTMPPEARPPRYPKRSSSITSAPARAAATAAACPAGPPPTTSTSVSATTGTCRPGSLTIAMTIGPPSPGRGGASALPPYQQPLQGTYHEEECERDGRGDHHGRVEERRPEIVRREDD